MIDIQNDFINGTLANKYAEKIIPYVYNKIKDFLSDKNNILFYTMDTHSNDYLDTHEGIKLPVPHCIENTVGWNMPIVIEKLIKSRSNAIMIKKNTFTSVSLPYEIIRILKNKNLTLTEIEIIGLCTDICVISNAMYLKNFFPDSEIIIDSSCCAGTNRKLHEYAIEIMKQCHITVI